MAQKTEEQEQLEMENVLKLLQLETESKKRQAEPRSLQELKDAVEDLKSDYSKNFDKLIDIQSKITLLKKIGRYDGQLDLELSEVQTKQDQYDQAYNAIRKELMQHTLGLFYVREDAFNIIANLDKIRTGAGLRPREIE